MRILYLIALAALLSTFFSCKSQQDAKKTEIFIKEFNWTITKPVNFDTVSAEEQKRLEKKGTEAIENTYHEKIENAAKNILFLKNDQFNYFESNYQPFDSIESGNYIENFRSVNDLLYGAFEVQMPNAKLDSTSSTEIISGLTFQTFNVKISLPDNKIMDFWMYSRLFGSREFSVNIITADKEKQNVLLEAWRSSKFGGD